MIGPKAWPKAIHVTVDNHCRSHTLLSLLSFLSFPAAVRPKGSGAAVKGEGKENLTE